MTAVEWLEQQLFNKLGKFTKGDIDQALEMEKQEKHSEYMRGWKDGYVKNETFKNTKK